MIGLYGFGIHLVKLGRVFLTLFIRGEAFTIWTQSITIFGKGLDFPGGASATNPDKLLGANETDPAKTDITAIGRALIASADSYSGRDVAMAAPSMYAAKSQTEHFLNSVVSSMVLNLSTATTTGTVTSVAIDGRSGVARATCGTTSTNNHRASIAHASNLSAFALGLGLGPTRMVFEAALSTALFDGTNVGRVSLGFSDSTGTGSGVDNVTFRTTNGGNWFCITTSNSVNTTTDTGIAANDLDVFHQFAMEVSADALQARFWIDGVLVATHIANIPSGVGRETAIVFCTQKTSAHTIGAGFDIDIVHFSQPATTELAA